MANTSPTRPLRVLLVTPDEAEAIAIRHAFAASGLRHKIVHYGAGDEALARLRADPSGFDALVVDHDLAGMTGLNLGALVREELPEVAVLLIAQDGAAAQRIASLARDAAIHDVIAKDAAGAYRDQLAGRVVGAVARATGPAGRPSGPGHERALVLAAADAIVGLTRRGAITSFNPAAERLYGRPAREVIGRPFSVLVPPERAGELSEALSIALEGDAPPPFYAVQTRADGTLIEVSLSLAPIRDAAGAVTGAVAIARDTSDHREREIAVTRALERERLILAQVPAVVWATDRNLRFLFVAGERLRRDSEVVGYLLEDILEPGSQAVVEAHRRAIAGERTTYAMRYGGVTYRAIVRPLADAGGAVIGTVGAALPVAD